MPGLLIKELPPELHRKLKEQAARNHRSMTKEVMVLLERALGQAPAREDFPAPFRGQFVLTDELIDGAKREGRR